MLRCCFGLIGLIGVGSLKGTELKQKKYLVLCLWCDGYSRSGKPYIFIGRFLVENKIVSVAITLLGEKTNFESFQTFMNIVIDGSIVQTSNPSVIVSSF